MPSLPASNCCRGVSKWWARKRGCPAAVDGSAVGGWRRSLSDAHDADIAAVGRIVDEAVEVVGIADGRRRGEVVVAAAASCIAIPAWRRPRDWPAPGGPENSECGQVDSDQHQADGQQVGAERRDDVAGR